MWNDVGYAVRTDFRLPENMVRVAHLTSALFMLNFPTLMNFLIAEIFGNRLFGNIFHVVFRGDFVIKRECA